MALVAPSHLGTLAEQQAKRVATAKWNIPARVDENDQARRLDERKLKAWRAKVWKRDKDICRCCEATVKHVLDLIPLRAEAHHIESREHRLTRYDVRNGLTLCHACHRRVTGQVADKLKVIASAWFTLDGRRYINGSKPITFRKVA